MLIVNLDFDPITPNTSCPVPEPHVQRPTTAPGDNVATDTPSKVIVCVAVVLFFTVATSSVESHVVGDGALHPTANVFGLYFGFPVKPILMLLFGNTADRTTATARNLGATVPAPADDIAPNTIGAAANTATLNNPSDFRIACALPHGAGLRDELRARKLSVTRRTCRRRL
jgi:hypothetical protein